MVVTVTTETIRWWRLRSGGNDRYGWRMERENNAAFWYLMQKDISWIWPTKLFWCPISWILIEICQIIPYIFWGNFIKIHFQCPIWNFNLLIHYMLWNCVCLIMRLYLGLGHSFCVAFGDFLPLWSFNTCWAVRILKLFTGVDFKMKLITISGKRLKLTIWDTGSCFSSYLIAFFIYLFVKKFIIDI